LHDSVTGERNGIPSVSIMTEKFISAAELMARVLGAEHYPFVEIPHPISSAALDQLQTTAAVATEACVARLTGVVPTN
jgi:hypothetical protein